MRFLKLLPLLIVATLRATTFQNDTFTDTTSTTLDLHVGELGSAWTIASSFATGAAVIEGNRIRSNSANECIYRCSALPPSSAEYSVTGVFHYFSSAGTSAYICGRLSQAGNFGLRAGYIQGSGQWTMEYNNAGSWTTLGTNFTQALVAGTDYTVKLDMVNGSPNDTINLYIDGVLRITAAASVTQGRPGCPGVSFNGNATSSTGIHISSLVSDSAASAPSFGTGFAFAFAGDSNGADYEFSGNVRFSMQTVTQALCDPTRWNTDRAWNFSLAGQTVASMVTLGSAQPGARFSLTSGFTKRIAILLGGNNDLAGGATGAAVWASTKAWCDARVAEGYVTVCMTVPANLGCVGAAETQRVAFNSALVADHSFSTYFLDAAILPAMSDNTNTTYWQTDKIHWQTAGAAAVADGIVNSVQTIHTYYVAKTGNDSNPGTLVSPWLTVGKAASTMVAGDTTNIAAGTYAEIVTQSTAGSSGAHITYAGAGAGSVTVSGFTVSASYVDISGINGSGAGVSSTDACFEYASGANHCTLTNCTVAGTSTITAGAKGVLVLQGADFFVAANVNQTNSNGHSWTLAGDNFSVTSCSVTSTNGWDGMHIVGSNGTVLGGTYTLSNPGSNPNHCDVFQTFGNDPTDVSQNVIIDSVYVALGSGYQLATMEDQQLNGNISLWTFRNCLFVDVDIIINCYTPNNTYENNTFVRVGTTSSDAISLGYSSRGHATGTTIKNNIFYLCGTATLTNQGWYAGDAAATGTVADYNVVVGTGAGTTKNNALWTTGNGITGTFEAHGINGSDPLFVSAGNFALQSGSPCKTAGVDLSSLFTKDITGATRPSGANTWSNGAYQFFATGNGGSSFSGKITIKGPTTIK